ncbi:hypothetical protein BD626DRAFT_408616 [Schizophyllum amplum]|uniref:Uncharacterized protein n=1 Tax=Schizophyllum amplum TaxID=97359 RepID=A0A550C4J0_9AGAR|nr:hypothetical protein BD626DRAFT_408616 [Auriculariopsis ampla]
MGMYQRPLPRSRTIYTKRFRALLFPCQKARPKAVEATYQGDRLHPERGRYVFASEEMDHRRLQPYIHDIVVSTTYRRERYTFRVFFKRHRHLPQNAAISALPGATVTFDGDVLVTSVGPICGIRNLNSAVQRRAARRTVCR